MKKWQIIVALAAVAIALLIVGPTYARRIRMTRVTTIALAAHSVALDLEATTNSTAIVSIPPELRKELAQVLTTPTDYLDTFRYRDEPPPLGDGTATHRVYIRNPDGAAIALRLRYDSKLKKFHVLSFWRTNAWPE